MVRINVAVWDQANGAPLFSRVTRRQVPAPPVAGDSPIALDGREATASIGTILLDAPPTQRYTPLMRRQRISMLLLLLLAAALASCSPGHLGGTEIAFLPDSHLFTISPDAANPFKLA